MTANLQVPLTHRRRPKQPLAVLPRCLSNAAVASYRSDELLNAIRTTNWKALGPASAYFYNPPWTIPFLRRNEIVIPVESEQK